VLTGIAVGSTSFFVAAAGQNEQERWNAVDDTVHHEEGGISPLRRARQNAHTDVGEESRELKGEKERDEAKDEDSRDGGGLVIGGFVSVGGKKKVNCKSSPEHPDCVTELVIVPSPTPAPTDQCQMSSFTSVNEDYVGDGVKGTPFSFTNEVDFVYSCADLTVGPNNGAIESVMVDYQNNLLMQYGCGDEIRYGAAVITNVCILNESGECVDDIAEVCGSEEQRRLQTSSIDSAKIRYNYNTLGNCRRRCAEQSLPKENDALGGRSLRRGEETGHRRAQGGEDRSGLVTFLNTAGVPTTGAAVISDGKNDCSAGSDDCCGDSGKCCGVTHGCTCPTVSQTYCTVTSCELPGCCGPAYLEMLNRSGPKFVGCPYTRPVCLCVSGDCYPFEANCDKYALCRDNTSVCPE